MAKTLENATRDELIRAIKFRRRHVQPALDDLSDERLRDEIRLLDATGAVELGGIWAHNLRHLVALGIIPEQVWRLLDEMAEQLCAIAISKYHGRDEVADYHLNAIYRLIFFTFFDIEKDLIESLANSKTKAWQTRGLRIRSLMVAFSRVVEPVKKGEYKEMFQPGARVRLSDREIYGDSPLSREAENLFPRNRKTTTLLELAAKKLAKELGAKGEQDWEERKLIADYYETEKWLKGLSSYRMGEMFAGIEEVELHPNQTFPYSTWFLENKDKRGGNRPKKQRK